MKKSDWLAKLSAKNSTSTMTFAQEHQDRIDKVKKKFIGEVLAGRTPKIMYGAFGPETKDSDAYIEEHLTEGGSRYKLYGCSYLYKGFFEDTTVHAIQMPKAILSEILSDMAKIPLVSLAFALSFVFSRKRLLLFIDGVFARIEHRVMRWYDIPEDYYNDFTKELKRSVNAHIDNGIWGRIVWRATKFVCLVFETDNAYRLRAQDALEGAYQKHGPAFTISHVLDVLISRETSIGIGRKWRFIKYALKVILPLTPTLKRIITHTLADLDMNKIKMDEADWYFSLRFLSYDFRGLGIKEREAERKRLDSLNNHIYLI